VAAARSTQPRAAFTREICEAQISYTFHGPTPTANPCRKSTSCLARTTDCVEKYRVCKSAHTGATLSRDRDAKRPVFGVQTRFSFGTTDMKQSISLPSFWEQSTSEAFCAAVVEFVQRQGAVSGIVKRMEQLGLGAIARSWLATDIHVPIFSEQLHALFGTGALRAFAARLGLQPRDLVRRLSQSLPRILNHLASSQRLSAPMY
jgi:uncharacterized protein YidB (DUF937 family)